LSLPHFDARERYFSYVWKSACIAKRRLVVQTIVENNTLLEYIKPFEWEGFVKEELSNRKEEHLPPYSRLIRARFLNVPQKALDSIPGEVSLRRINSVVDMLIRVDKSKSGQVLKAVRSLKPIELEVV
jgi:primosomal protein N'